MNLKDFSTGFGCLALSLVASALLTGAVLARDSNPYKTNILQQLAKSKQALISSGSINGCVLRARSSAPKPEIVVNTLTRLNSKPTEYMSAFLITNSTRWYFGNDKAAAQQTVDALRSWAAASAHSEVVSRWQSASSPRWSTYELMMSSMNAMLLLDNYPGYDEATQTLVQNWVTRTLKSSYIFSQLPSGRAGDDDKEQRVNNHNARRALVLLYHGILTGSQNEIRKSAANMRRTINHIDKSGAFPRDAERGDWGLRYSNFSLDAAVMHMSLMNVAQPGSVKRKSVDALNRAGVFLFGETVSPAKIDSYARKNIGRDTPYKGRQNNNWINSQQFEAGSLWWAYVSTPIFRANMPEAYAASKRALSGHRAWRRVGYSLTGGAVKCWFAA